MSHASPNDSTPLEDSTTKLSPAVVQLSPNGKGHSVEINAQINVQASVKMVSISTAEGGTASNETVTNPMVPVVYQSPRGVNIGISLPQ